MSILSDWYDRANTNEYPIYADFLTSAFRRFSGIEVRELLDLGCGTGGITKLMADAGFDMVALDLSPDMLAIASERGGALYLCQDMRSFELYGTVQGVYSSYDCLNCISAQSELEKVFSLVHLYLEQGGLFIFDVNTLYRASDIYDGRCYCFESGDDMLVWQSELLKNRTLHFYLTEFSRRRGGYERRDELLTQRIWSVSTLKTLLCKCGFNVRAVFGGTDFSPLTARSEKAYFIAERI